MSYINIVEKTKEKYLGYEKRHQDILDAAIRMFNAKGYTPTTTAEMAKAASVSEPIMYKHYHSKQELFVACFQSISEELLSSYRKVYKENIGNEVGYLEGVSRVYINFVEKNPHKSMFLVHLLSYREFPEFDRIFMDFMKSSVEGVRRVIASAQKKGIIKSKISDHILAGFFVNQYFTVVALKELGISQPVMNKTFVEIVRDMMKME